MSIHPPEHCCVLTTTPLPKALDYITIHPVKLGQIVQVPLGSRKTLGVVWPQDPDLQLKPQIIKSITQNYEGILSTGLMQTLSWMSRYTTAKMGTLLKLVFAGIDPFSQMRKNHKTNDLLTDFADIQLSEMQQKAYADICTHLPHLQPIVLDGVTGSGKTEVYMKLIQDIYTQGKQCLILVPEIALTPDWEQRFEKRFGFSCLIWHSQISSALRKHIWHKAIRGEPLVIVGARSALFLPLSNLGFIVVDEEHDGSFKQEDPPVYHARDMAVLRAQYEKIPILLSSATPSLETYGNIQTGKYKHVTLTARFGSAHLPSITVADMRIHEDVMKEEGVTISGLLLERMAETLAQGNQVLLFLNRRGFAPLSLCNHCGQRMGCPRCSTMLVEHRNHHKLQCHQCGYQQQIPEHCPTCHKGALVSCGAGVERLHTFIEQRFPTYKSAIVSSDYMNSLEDMAQLLDQAHSNDIRILIGTQVLAKGHHFPHLTLVGIMDADAALTSSSGFDMRASERTYQMIQQVSGRAGRAHKPGQVILQTFQPDHPVIQALVNNDRDSLYEWELAQRQSAHLPPFGRLVAVIISATQQSLVKNTVLQMKATLPQHPDVTIFGPTPAPIEKIRNHYRWRFLLQSSKQFPLSDYVQTWLSNTTILSSVRIKVDVDPYQFF